MLKLLKNALPRLTARLNGIRGYCDKTIEPASAEALARLLTQRDAELIDILVRFSSQEWVDQSLLSYTMPATMTRLLRWRRQEFDELKQEYENQAALLDKYRSALTRIEGITNKDNILDTYVKDLYELRDLNQSDPKATDATDQVQRPEGS